MMNNQQFNLKHLLLFNHLLNKFNKHQLNNLSIRNHNILRKTTENLMMMKKSKSCTDYKWKNKRENKRKKKKENESSQL